MAFDFYGLKKRPCRIKEERIASLKTPTTSSREKNRDFTKINNAEGRKYGTKTIVIMF